MASSSVIPFAFLIISLTVSEIFLVVWMNRIFDVDTDERIIVGALSITILIAVLVISCVMYKIRISSETENKKINHDLGDHGIGTLDERTKITLWHKELLYYDTTDNMWYYNSNTREPKGVTWTKVSFDPIESKK